MMAAPSIFSLVAAVLYLVVAGAVAAAGVLGARHRQVAWHRLVWGVVAAVFVGLALMRFYNVEEWLRGDLRQLLRLEQSYEDRRDLQKPLFAIIFLVATAMAGGFVYFLAKGVQGRRNIAVFVAIGCTGGLIFLLALRLVSLHSVDAVLYGRFKVNWFADLGMTIAVMACAISYCLIVGRSQR